jgi:hypothetical protein
MQVIRTGVATQIMRRMEILIAAFTLGLAGSTHCAGMCGGIAGALCMGVREEPRAARLAPHLLAHNLGRSLTYALLGAVFGGLAQALGWEAPVKGWPLGAILSALFVIAAGLYLLGLTASLAWLERAGLALWRSVQPVTRHLLPARHAGQSLLLGLLWGFLPCGLVYAALALAMSASDPLAGASVMLAFALGTWPMLLAIGFGWRRLAAFNGPGLRRGAGVLATGLGVWLLAMAMLPGGHDHTGHAASVEAPGTAHPHHHH